MVKDEQVQKVIQEMQEQIKKIGDNNIFIAYYLEEVCGLKPVCTYGEQEHLLYINRNGKIIYNIDDGYFIKGYCGDNKRKQKRLYIKMQFEDGKPRNFLVHKLVADAFGINPNNLNIHHIDGDSLNNDISNLLPCTQKQHTKLHKLMRQGKKQEYINYVKKLRKENTKPWNEQAQ